MGTHVVNDWDALRQLRMSGRKPSLPVIVTTNEILPQRLEGVGCMTILHRAGEVMPVKLLDGLDVIFWFAECQLAAIVDRLAHDKGVKFASSRVWCNCSQMLSILPMYCTSHADMVNWFESMRAPLHA